MIDSTTMLAILQKSIDNVRNGTTVGIALVEVQLVNQGSDWGTATSYQGPLLCLLAGATQLSHVISAASITQTPVKLSLDET